MYDDIIYIYLYSIIWHDIGLKQKSVETIWKKQCTVTASNTLWNSNFNTDTDDINLKKGSTKASTSVFGIGVQLYAVSQWYRIGLQLLGFFDTEKKIAAGFRAEKSQEGLRKKRNDQRPAMSDNACCVPTQLVVKVTQMLI